MSLDWCRECRHVGLCTFPRNRAVSECDEFEHMASGPSHEWNLQDLLKLWAVPDEVPDPAPK